LHFIKDDEHPAELVATLRDALSPGSYLALSHVTGDFRSKAAADAMGVYNQATSSVTLRSHNQISAFFSGFELLPGGTVTVTVTATRGEVVVKVTDDGGPGHPAIREGQDPCAEDGRGLLLVAQLSVRWGYHRGDGKLTTWFQVPAEPA
jgi:S-adenosyl methyltransferase/histidine kinase-like protein